MAVKVFEELTVPELYNILDLRARVFVVEQNCAYQDIDHHDQTSLHILGNKAGQLIAYARIVVPGEICEEASIGRVTIHPSHRNRGYGRRIFGEALEETKRRFPDYAIKIQAQCYLEDFYKSMGFRTVSEPYPDVGVWHIDMLLKQG